MRRAFGKWGLSEGAVRLPGIQRKLSCCTSVAVACLPLTFTYMETDDIK
jgi:hypothetical protein